MNSSPAREHYTAMREKTPRPARLSVDMDWRRIEMNAALLGVTPWEYYLFIHRPDEYREMKAQALRRFEERRIAYENSIGQTKHIVEPPHPWWRFW